MDGNVLCYVLKEIAVIICVLCYNSDEKAMTEVFTSGIRDNNYRSKPM